MAPTGQTGKDYIDEIREIDEAETIQNGLQGSTKPKSLAQLSK